jgi:hypothetical protein
LLNFMNRFTHRLSLSMRMAQFGNTITEVMHHVENQGKLSGVTFRKLVRWNSMGTKYASLAGAGELSLR